MTDQLAKVQNEQATAQTSLEFLDHYGKSMEAIDVDVRKVNDFLSLYLDQRAKLGESHQQSISKITEMEKQVEKLTRKANRLERAFLRAKKTASKQDRREREKKRKEKEQNRKEKQRVRNEQGKFWPVNIGQVVLHLDGFPGFTPNSSRRSSIALGKKPDPAEAAASETYMDTVSLSLTYVTMKAAWAPRYEMSLKTPTSSGKIVYRAEFHNYSSETWQDAKVILSTSQTSFSGLDEKIPLLQPWHVKLGKGEEDQARQNKNANWSGGLENKTEISSRISNNLALQGKSGNMIFANPSVNARPEPQAVQQIQQWAPQQQSQASQLLFTAPTGGLFGSSSATTYGTSRAVESQEIRLGTLERDGLALGTEADEQFDDIDSETLSAPSNVLAFQESFRQDYGLTTTYDIHGQRTLQPSSRKRHHVIAELDLTSITLAHILIPKLRPAAFLRARIKNTSPVTLLRGKAGLTLDGTFLGTTSLPACSPDHTFALSLGVDPSILINYAKPCVRRATSGFFAKEDCAIFTRVCFIKNTKTTPVSVLVLDQIPVSEDERLRVNILEPKGLEKEGDRVKMEGTKGNWGKGFVIMGKGGEVKWELTLERAKEVKLVLEYEAKIPSGQKIVGLD
jgi:hypothetical protein